MKSGCLLARLVGLPGPRFCPLYSSIPGQAQFSEGLLWPQAPCHSHPLNDPALTLVLPLGTHQMAEDLSDLRGLAKRPETETKWLNAHIGST